MNGVIRDQIAATLRDQEFPLAEAVVALQYERQPEFWEPYGEAGRDKGIQDMKYHFSFLLEAIRAGDPSLFAEYVAWVKELFAGLRFPDEVMIETLECTRQVFQARWTPEQMIAVTPFLDAGVQEMRKTASASASFLDDDSSLGALAQQYLRALLRGERQAASQMILSAVEQGTSLKGIYLHVFQRSQYEIGRLWMLNQVNVAQEHYCTAATQLIMSQLYSYIFATPKIGRRLVAACVGGELHEIGIRMVADFFELEGWDTYYIGANAPTATILSQIEHYRPDVVGLSVTMGFHRSAVQDLIRRIRDTESGSRLKILVGGYSFLKRADLWKVVGADGSARDAEEAVRLASRLVGLS
ncbi:cobalamin B12-binding domain protein [Candidatus Moduliflexus flocculans]|uniref:Cobalamin B12-binding domain protein n=1 Tax=Candidatus Moduliflexus flocculans TaxID=1499966 RepID=A0A0S6W7D1_9BACT|nr:cobalamin B12-binding domain protein [Candidatus Moduliflexus flocculans]